MAYEFMRAEQDGALTFITIARLQAYDVLNLPRMRSLPRFSSLLRPTPRKRGGDHHWAR